MKTKQQIKEKEFDTLKTFRAIKEKISKDVFGIILPQIQEYLKQQKNKNKQRLNFSKLVSGESTENIH